MKVILLISDKQSSPEIHKGCTPVALTKLGGKFLLEHLISELLILTEEDIQELLFITPAGMGQFHDTLKQIATKFNLKTHVYSCEQFNSPLDAITCVAESLKGPALVMPANIWFKSGSALKSQGENMVFVLKVDAPLEQNVVKIEMNNTISGFYQKSNEYISDLMPVGGYFFKESEQLLQNTTDLLSNRKGELDLTHLIEHKIKKGERFFPYIANDWINGYNKEDILAIHQKVIANFNTHKHISDTVQILNTVVISPVYIGENAKILNSVVGPNVSLGEGTVLENALISNSVLASNAQVKNVKIDASLLGKNAIYEGKEKCVNLGDYSYLKE